MLYELATISATTDNAVEQTLNNICNNLVDFLLDEQTI